MRNRNRWAVALLVVAGLGFAPAVAHSADAPRADAPQYDAEGLWPADVRKTDYFRETWPKAPLLVWAGTERTGEQVNPRDPANWLLDGRPAPHAPNADTDVYFPPGSIVRVGWPVVTMRVRHLTVGEGVRVPKALAIRPAGNVWIKVGGRVEEVGAFTGPKNIFVRNDNPDFASTDAALANKIVFNKAPDASVEVLGVVRAHDELSVLCGTLIIGPDALLAPGNRSVQYIYPDGRLVLMSGATFHKRGNQTWDNDLVVAGELLAGTPERPLTRDCTIALSWKRKGEGPPPNAGSPNDYGMVIRPDGTLRVHTVDPSRARLVITWNGLAVSESGERDDGSQYVDVVLQGDLHLSGVLFDRILKGGIRLPDPALRRQWNLAFGPHNQGAPDELFSVLEEPVNPRLRLDVANPPRPYSEQTEEEKARDQDFFK